MWYDSFDNSEPSQLWQDNETASYQFGTLSEQLSQDDFDELSCQYIQQPMEYNTPRIQTEAWPDMGCSLYIREIPSQYNVPGSSYTAQDVGHAQTTHSQPPEDFDSSVTVNCPVRESKSVILNKIQNLQSTSFALDEEIEEQKRRNASLEKQIAEAKEQLSKIEAQKTNLLEEFKAFEEKNREEELKLDEEIGELTEIIAKKRRNISEIKYDAEMVNTLREEKDKMAEELKALRDDIVDVDLDVFWLEYTYKQEFDKMIIFPYWKLEEDLERALRGEDPTLHKEEGPPERNDEDGDGYDYEDHDFYDCEGNDDTKEKSSSDCHEGLDSACETSESDSCQSTNKTSNSDSGPSASRKTKGKRGRRFGKKKQGKTSKFSRFVDWLRRMSCIPKGYKDD